MSAILVQDLYYRVKPHFWSTPKEVLKGVSFEVPQGSAFGFLGPNGAGKTTTIKTILGLLTPQSGTVQVLGDSMAELNTRMRIGFMPEHPYFPLSLTGKEFLVMHAALARIDGPKQAPAVDRILQEVGLQDHRDKLLQTYSKGMLQRIGLGQALIHDPDLIILDEPMSGLDPMGRHDVRNILESLKQKGKTIFFSSHILPDVESICDEVALLIDGSIRTQGRLSALIKKEDQSIEIVTEPFNPSSLTELQSLIGHLDESQIGVRMKVHGTSHANQAIDLLRKHDIVIKELTRGRQTLEDLFVQEAASA